MIARPRLASFSLALLILVACEGRGSEEGDASPVGATDDLEVQTGEAAEEEQPSPPAAALSRRSVTIYFPSTSEDGLRGETREIFDTASPEDRAKQILSDLLAGPSEADGVSVLPPGTRLRQVFVLESGIAYVDFSSELRDGMSGGSRMELMAVYAIVNSLVLNIPEVRRVGILIDGRPCRTLNGHVDLRRPLPPKTGFLQDWTGTRSSLGSPDPDPKA